MAIAITHLHIKLDLKSDNVFLTTNMDNTLQCAEPTVYLS